MWKAIFTAILGIFIMAAPSIFNYADARAAANERIIGPLFVTFAITSIWEATRVVRKFNLPFAIWLMFAPIILFYQPKAASFIDIGVGIAVIILSLLPYKVTVNFGGGWSAIWKKNPMHLRAAKQQTQALEHA